MALGFVLVYKATELVNFAQGDLLMLGAFTCYMFVIWYHLGYWAAFALAIAIVAVFGAVLDWAAEDLVRCDHAIAPGMVVTSSITVESVDDLKLKPGDKAYAIIKSSEVIVGKD